MNILSYYNEYKDKVSRFARILKAIKFIIFHRRFALIALDEEKDEIKISINYGGLTEEGCKAAMRVWLNIERDGDIVLGKYKELLED